MQPFQRFAAGVFRQIGRDQRHRTIFEDPLIEPRQHLLRADFEKQVNSIGGELLDQLHIPHGGRELLDEIVPHGLRTTDIFQRDAAEEFQLRSLNRGAFQRRTECRFGVVQQRRVIRPRHIQHAGGEALGLQQPLDAVDGIGSSPDHGLIGRVVAGEIRRTGQVRQQPLDNIQRRGGRHQAATGAFTRFDGIRPLTRNFNRIAEGHRPGSDECGELAIAVRADDVRPQAFGHQQPGNERVGDEHRQLREEHVLTEMLVRRPGKVRKPWGLVLNENRVEFLHDLACGLGFVHKVTQHARVLRALTGEEERDLRPVAGFPEIDTLLFEQTVRSIYEMLGRELQLLRERLRVFGDNRQPHVVATVEVIDPAGSEQGTGVRLPLRNFGFQRIQ